MRPYEPLPGERFVDLELVSRTIEAARQALRRRGTDAPIELARIVLTEFFAGDPGQYRARSRRHASFRRFVADLRVARSVVSRAVGTWEQVQQLPPDLSQGLPVTHHYLLLPIEDVATKVDLARRAVEERLTCRAFGRIVRDARGAGGGAAAAIARELETIDTALTAALRLSTAEDLDREACIPLADDLGRHIDRMRRLKETLRPSRQEAPADERRALAPTL